MVDYPDHILPPRPGSTSLEVLRYIADRYAPPGSYMLIGSYFPRLGIDERLRDPGQPKAKWCRPWDQVVERVESALDMEPLVAMMGRHLSHPTEGTLWVPAASIAAGGWREQAEESLFEKGDPTNQVMALCSSVRTSDDRIGLQLPLLDFRCPPGEKSLQFVVAAIRFLGFDRGVILDSGRSYHFYGFRFLASSEWRTFMYRCLLLEPYTDARYIGHRLLDGVAWLRLTENAAKPKRPEVVFVIGL